MEMANTLAYYHDMATITVIKRFIVQAPTLFPKNIVMFANVNEL
jgi:hypothetical protein